MIALHDLLVAGHPPDTNVCHERDASIPFSAFRERTLALALMFAAQPARRYALCIDDVFDFTCALFALWAARKEPVLPPNATPACLADLASAWDVVLTDASLTGAAPATAPTINAAIDAHAPLTLFTSGSSSAPKAIHKTLAQLNAEMHTLQAQFGACAAGATHVGAVPHHHIYGLLFNVLWPLFAGRAFTRENVESGVSTPQRIAACVARWNTVMVAATPAQLARWPELPGFAALGQASCTFFSSGGPLDEATALRYLSMCGASPIEIYGSTETGGVGWRRRDGSDRSQAWQTMPGIEVRCAPEHGNALDIRSPHLPDNRWWRTDDAVSFDADGRFRLCGRLDRVRKLAGKRVSLAALEQRLAQHDYVAQAAVLVLEDTARERLGALVALTPAGTDALLAQGRVALTKTLHRHLAGRFELVVLPRRWRFCSALPFDARGKLPASAVMAAFSAQPEGFEMLAQARCGNEAHYELRVPATLAHFAGHFPDLPILPGAVQIDWAMRLACAWAEDAQQFASIDRLKFTQPVFPGAVLRLTLRHDPQQHRVQFVYRWRGHDCTAGVFVYHSAAQA